MNFAPGQYLLVVTNAAKAVSQAVFAILDPDVGGDKTFACPLSANGNLPATHWAASTLLEQATIDALPQTAAQFKTFIDAVQVARNRPPIGAITGFKNNVQLYRPGQLVLGEPVTMEQWLTSIGLQRIVGTL